MQPYDPNAEQVETAGTDSQPAAATDTAETGTNELVEPVSGDEATDTAPAADAHEATETVSDDAGEPTQADNHEQPPADPHNPGDPSTC